METIEDLNRRYADALLPLTLLFGVFIVCGVVGNNIVLVVFSLGRSYRRNNFRVFVTFIALIDLACCVLIFPSEMAKHRHYFNFTSVALCKVKVFVNMWGAVSCALALLVISVDRYRKVCCPLKRQISYSLALKLCGLVTFVISIIVAAPFSAFHGIMAQNKTNMYHDKTEVYICTITEEYRNHPLTKISQLASMAILGGVSVSATVMYILIGRQIYMHWGAFSSKIRSDSLKDSHSDNTTEHSHTQQTPQSSCDNSHPLAVNIELKNTDNITPLTGKEPEQIEMLPSTEIVHSIEKARSATADARSKTPRSQNKGKLSRLISVSSLGSGYRGESRRSTFGRRGSRLTINTFPYKTLIWFILTLIFISTNVLSIVMTFLNPDSINKNPKQYVLFCLFTRLMYINNCINPIVYAFLDKHFRNDCRNIRPMLKKLFKRT